MAQNSATSAPCYVKMKEDFSIYCVTDVSVPPLKLSRRTETSFYVHISIPVPETLVLFCLGRWMGEESLEATLSYKDETISLGLVSTTSRCICWEMERSEIPALMTSDNEKGMAKLVLERPDLDEYPVLTPEQNISQSSRKVEDFLTKSIPEESSGKTDKHEEETKETQERQTKTKKRGKEKTLDEPSAKKQRTQKKSTTRLRSVSKELDSKTAIQTTAETDPPVITAETEEENLKNKENRDLNIPNNVQTEKNKIINNHIKDEKVFPEVSTGMKKAVTCKDLTTRALRPSSRWGHSLCFVNKNLSVLIGGQGDKQQINKDSVWTLDTETRKWRCPNTFSEGQKPEYRMGHTATYDPMVRCIYVFGGSKNTRWFHDVHILDVDEWKWQLVKVSGKAPTRAYHSATLYRHELWIFGGVYPRPDPQPDGCSNDIHIFSPVMESWYSPIVKGEKPIPRSGHSATLINDQMVVFGGWDAPISYSDLHILDMSIVEWTEPKVTGVPPKPRSWHASCALSGQRIMIHGGYDGNLALDDTHIFSMDKLCWTQVKVENKPLARVGHKALCMPYRHDNEEEDEVIIFGGGDNDGAYFEDLIGLYVPFKAAEELVAS